MKIGLRTEIIRPLHINMTVMVAASLRHPDIRASTGSHTVAHRRPKGTVNNLMAVHRPLRDIASNPTAAHPPPSQEAIPASISSSNTAVLPLPARILSTSTLRGSHLCLADGFPSGIDSINAGITLKKPPAVLSGRLQVPAAPIAVDGDPPPTSSHGGQGYDSYSHAPSGTSGYEQYPSRGHGEYYEGGQEKEKKKKDHTLLYAAGGLAAGAIGGALIANALRPAFEPLYNADGEYVDASDRESVASAREEYEAAQRAAADSDASSSEEEELEEAREEYYEEYEEAYE
ncbi:hypothetical protein ONZ43_g3923 [Nemania bipapillata]|uniref:Uncharacterized protein n=1 Tax=Nemania bipapillata TaxID=110536 RepID=A0ACC2IUD1_9PEZI|nr:hypothetical protein ONZ43_g3923 [Nemania bipapillata]